MEQNSCVELRANPTNENRTSGHLRLVNEFEILVSHELETCRLLGQGGLPEMNHTVNGT